MAFMRAMSRSTCSLAAASTAALAAAAARHLQFGKLLCQSLPRSSRPHRQVCRFQRHGRLRLGELRELRPLLRHQVCRSRRRGRLHLGDLQELRLLLSHRQDSDPGLPLQGGPDKLSTSSSAEKGISRQWHVTSSTAWSSTMPAHFGCAHILAATMK